MKSTLLLLVLIILYNLSLAQKQAKSIDTLSSYNMWQSSWKYFKFKKKIIGVVLEQHPTTVLCGHFATASNAIIVTIKNDTIRVLELCNVDRAFSKSDKVEIIPATTPKFFIDFIPPTKFDKNIKRTTYGSITKIN